jgi:hypothetical protein
MRARRPVRERSPGDATSVGVVGLAAVVALGYGWHRRGELDLIAEEGLGYALGVLGLAMMSLLLLYSLRKHWSPLQSVGAAPTWLKIHMMLGILGPTAILYHANFRLGSLNSRMALLCMLVVSGSGIVGRFLYTRTHQGSGWSQAFSLWHALHLPFCVVLFAAAFVHVVAVHMY